MTKRIRDLDLSSKDAYLAWVAHWKEAWHIIVAEIREAKARKRHHRDTARSLRRRLRVSGDAHAQISEHMAEMFRAHHDRERLRWQADWMIGLRLEGKVESWKRRCALLAESDEAA